MFVPMHVDLNCMWLGTWALSKHNCTRKKSFKVVIFLWTILLKMKHPESFSLKAGKLFGSCFQIFIWFIVFLQNWTLHKYLQWRWLPGKKGKEIFTLVWLSWGLIDAFGCLMCVMINLTMEAICYLPPPFHF